MTTKQETYIVIDNTGYTVEFLGERTSEDGHTEFQYDVNYSSFGCGVTFTYMPIDDEPEEDGRIACDLDVHAGGDCVGFDDVLLCLRAAKIAHEQFGVAKRFRETNG